MEAGRIANLKFEIPEKEKKENEISPHFSPRGKSDPRDSVFSVSAHSARLRWVTLVSWLLGAEVGRQKKMTRRRRGRSGARREVAEAFFSKCEAKRPESSLLVRNPG